MFSDLHLPSLISLFLKVPFLIGSRPSVLDALPNEDRQTARLDRTQRKSSWQMSLQNQCGMRLFVLYCVCIVKRTVRLIQSVIIAFLLMAALTTHTIRKRWEVQSKVTKINILFDRSPSIFIRIWPQYIPFLSYLPPLAVHILCNHG